MEQLGAIEVAGVYGGWHLEDTEARQLPQNVASAIEKVYEGREETVVPVYYFGYQIVNGTNYLLICRRTRKVEGIEKIDYVRVNVHVPLGRDGYKNAELIQQEVAEETILSPRITKLYEEATKYLIGVEHVPILLIGTQIVKGTNYHFLCESRVIKPGAIPYLSRIIINEYGEDISIVEIKKVQE